MKVLMLNGSARPKGNTYIALKEIGEQLLKEGIDYEIVNVGNQPLRDCIGCNRCTEEGCIFTDDGVNDFVAKAREADGFVFGSPVYYGQPNGALLAVVQRMLYAGGALMRNKPVANVIVCRRGGATAAYQTMNMAFEMCNMPIVTSQYWNLAYGRDPGEVEQDVEGMQTMRTLAENMAWLLKKIHADGAPAYPEHEPWQPMNFIR